jgi:hypothetical protein
VNVAHRSGESSISPKRGGSYHGDESNPQDYHSGMQKTYRIDSYWRRHVSRRSRTLGQGVMDEKPWDDLTDIEPEIQRTANTGESTWNIRRTS